MDNYDLELDRVADKIKQEKAESVLIQLPDGLKPKAKEIQEELKKIIKAKLLKPKETNVIIMFWAGTCFGACDVPKVNVDLIVQFGHSEWR